MEKKYEGIKFGFSQYLNLLETAVINPNQYSRNLKNLSFGQSLTFFILSASFWLLLSTVIKTFLIGKYHLFFGVLSEILFLILAIFLLILLFTLLLHLLAKLAGSRTKIKNNLKAVMFSTILLPFFAIPIFKALAGIISVYILIFCFKSVNRFDKLKVFVLVIIPVGIFIFALYAMGIININLVTR